MYGLGTMPLGTAPLGQPMFQASKAAADAPTLSVTDATVSPVVAALSRTDNPTVVITDATSTIVATLARADTPTVVITDATSGIAGSLSTSDNPTAAITDASAVAAVLSRSDTPSFGIVDDTHIPGYIRPNTGYVYADEVAAHDIVGDIDVRAFVAPDTWAPRANQAIISKAGGPGARSWYMRYQATDGALILSWSEDGSNVKSAVSTAGLALAPGEKKWVRAVLDVDNGAGKWAATFYTSDDGTTWTQLGITVVPGSAGTTSIFSSTQPIQVGAFSAGSQIDGKVFWAEVRNGIAGTVVATADFRQRTTAADFTDAQGNSWHYSGSAAQYPSTYMLATASASDTPTVVITDATSSIVAALSRADTPTVVITDATSTIVATLAAADSPTVVITDATSSLAAVLSRSDNPTLSITDAVSAIAAVLSRSDNPTVSITDASAAQVGKSASDYVSRTATIREDTFNRADAGSLGTPSDGGSAWYGGGWGITGNQAAPTGSSNTVVLDSGLTDVSVEFTHAGVADPSGNYWVAVRATGSGGSGGVAVIVMSNGTQAKVNVEDNFSTRRAGIFGELALGDTLRLVVVGTTAELYLNGVLWWTDTVTATGDGAGRISMWHNGSPAALARVENLRVLDPAVVPLVAESSALQAALSAADFLPKGPSAGATLRSDNWNRANVSGGDPLGTPSGGGPDWDTSGNWGISSNRLVSSASAYARLATTHGDVFMETTFIALPSSGGTGLFARGNDSLTEWVAATVYASGTIVLRDHAGSGSYAYSAAGVIAGNDTLRLVVIGSDVAAYVNGVEVVRRTTTASGTTQLGYMADSAVSGIMDDFSARVATGALAGPLIVDEVDDLDTAANVEPVAGSDTPSLSVTDAASTIAAVLATSDNPTVSTPELPHDGSTQNRTIQAVLSGTDNPTVAIADAVSAIAGVLSRSDTPTLVITDASGTVVVSLSRSDDPTVVITDATVSIAAALSRSDNPTVSVVDVSSIAGTLSRTDTLLLALGLVQNGLSNPTPTSGADWNTGPSLTYDATAGALRHTTQGTVMSQTKIPIQPGAPLTITADVKGDPAVGNFYLGFVSYDGDGSVIGHEHAAHRVGTETTLAAPLNPGDTTITLTSSANWQNAGATHERSVKFWPGGVYQESNGLQHAPYTYTRWLYNNVYGVGGISGNVITLSVPWAGPAYASGTPVANALSGGSYNYIAAQNVPLPSNWTTYSGTADKRQVNPVPGNDEIRHGTQSVAFVALVNYPPGGGQTLLRNMAVTTAAGESVAIAAVLAGSDAPAVAITDARLTLVVSAAVSDSLNVGVTDTVSAIAAALSRSDNPTVSIADATAALLAALSRTDNPTVVITEGTSAVLGAVAAADAPTLGVTEGAPTVVVTLARSDTPTVTLGESVVLAATLAGTDSLVVSLLEQTGLGGGDFISSSDSLQITITDASSGAVTAVASDSVIVGLTDQRLDLSVFLAALEALGISLSDAAVATAVAAVSDTLGVAITDAGAAAITLAASDNPTVRTIELPIDGSTSTRTVKVFLSGTDPLNFLVDDVSVRAVSLSRTDTLALGVTDSASLFAVMAGSEIFGLVVDEASETAVVLSAADLQQLELLEAVQATATLSVSDLLTVAIAGTGVVELPEAIWGAVVQVISILARVQSIGALERVSTITAVPRSETIAVQARTQGTSQVEREQDIESIEGLAVIPADA